MARKPRTDEDEEPLEEELDEEGLPEDELEEVVFRRRVPGIGLFACGIVLGALIGAGITILTAPARGKVTRRRVRRRLRDLQADARSHLDDWRDDAERGLHRHRRRIRRRVRPRRA